MLKLKAGDTVKITAGKDKGREGKIEKIFPKQSKALIPGVNIYKKHVKGQQGQKGGIYDIPRPLDFAKIALICPKCKKATRVGFKIVEKSKSRVCKKCNKEIDTK
ncbi:50S ribosomal protein L24 [Patescibacteria group bacterium]|nr:50S ribosomal protein L24 [Patescibacteria group bacterium]MBU0776802.1 50S ribosomal protein L24 [Patescibacteria group bacterium]MBU0845623.1 50S ribosomal protein L24 [Patescibacteria group bacterium]MBU0922665.1 50S ribosomal protein L24 [Patescibacteria group bacterium]MBU1066716.1 50S ribosomal protein L24 [Patescibacteria group bacterium]